MPAAFGRAAPFGRSLKRSFGRAKALLGRLLLKNKNLTLEPLKDEEEAPKSRAATSKSEASTRPTAVQKPQASKRAQPVHQGFARLKDPVPIHTLVWLRIAIGLLGGGDILGNGIYYHWYKDAFAGFTFRYYGFEWVHPLPEPFFSLFFITGFLAGIAVAVGYRFRIAAPVLAISFSYLFLLEKAHYLNHAYLFSWLAWLIVFTPAWRELSFDAWRKPMARSRVCPRWSIALFPLMMGIVYFFGGVAKINADWLLQASPLHSWLSARGDILLIGPLLELKETAYLFAWGGFLLDLSVAFLLLHKRLRWWALAAVVFFHAMNHLIFNIGIFPYLSLVMSSLWFEPDWPGRFVNWLGSKWNWVRKLQLRWESHFVGLQTCPAEDEAGRGSNVGNADAEPSPLPKYTGHNPFVGQLESEREDWFDNYDRPIFTPWVTLLLAAIIAVHVFLPLRHHFIPGDVGWTEEGHRYSWRMMLRSKRGSGYFRIIDSTGKETKVYPRDRLYPRQARKLYTHPDMILQFAHHLASECADTTGNSCQVYAKIKARLNDGKYYPYIDPEVNLAEVEWIWLGRKKWVLEEGND
ncbi:hypothetical protein CEQ90_02615 [Lewinellaceae bacterium SD302]|nr:hypothetical protein CEQ90_02615 [Lewinellaceae bacterium SD302]